MPMHTVAYFATGGLFTALYSNAVRRFPLMRKPKLHIACVGVGTLLGFQVHLYQEDVAARGAEIVDRQYNKTETMYKPLVE